LVFIDLTVPPRFLSLLPLFFITMTPPPRYSRDSISTLCPSSSRPSLVLSLVTVLPVYFFTRWPRRAVFSQTYLGLWLLSAISAVIFDTLSNLGKCFIEDHVAVFRPLFSSIAHLFRVGAGGRRSLVSSHCPGSNSTAAPDFTYLGHDWRDRRFFGNYPAVYQSVHLYIPLP